MSRQFRNHIASSPPPINIERPGNTAKFEAGQFGKNIVVADDGTITISKKAYADDIVAFVLGAIRSNPTIDDTIKANLARFVDEMDKRAVDRHGYSHSKEEADFEWNSVEDALWE